MQNDRTIGCPPSPYHVGLGWGVIGTIFVCCAGSLGMEYLLPAWARLWLWLVGVVGMLTCMACAEVLRRRGWVWNASGLKTGFVLVALVYMIPVFFNLQRLLESE